MIGPFLLVFSEQPDGNLTNKTMKYENKKLLFYSGLREATTEKLRFTKDDRELAKTAGKPSYYTTISVY